MIIDCHGHYTTAPPALEAWRKRQIEAFDNGTTPPGASGLQISDDELRESIEGNQLRLHPAIVGGAAGAECCGDPRRDR